MKKTSLTLPFRLRSVDQRQEGTTVIEFDLEGGWGAYVERLIDSACKVAGQPELAEKMRDILIARKSYYKIVEKT